MYQTSQESPPFRAGECQFRLYHDAVFVTEAIQTSAAVRKELQKEVPNTKKMRDLVKWDEE